MYQCGFAGAEGGSPCTYAGLQSPEAWPAEPTECGEPQFHKAQEFVYDSQGLVLLPFRNP